MANQVGKRYVCERCGSELLVTKAGEGSLSCCGQPMQLKGSSGSAQASVSHAGR